MKKLLFFLCGAVLLLTVCLRTYWRLAPLPLRVELPGTAGWVPVYILYPLFYLCLGVLLAMAVSRSWPASGFLRFVRHLGRLLVLLYAVGAFLEASGLSIPLLLSSLQLLLTYPALFLVPGALLGLGL
ncbi:MAG: hypothetical protein IJ713_03725 [Oscillibacter sp.]|nr:hypothetical protein [Oscillibacter sp.]